MQFSGPRPSESSDLVLVGRSSGYEQSHARMPERSERPDCLDGPLDDPGSSPACIHAAPFLFAHIHVTVYRWSARFVTYSVVATYLDPYVNTASRPDRKHATGDKLGRAPIAFSFSFLSLYFSLFPFSVFVSLCLCSVSDSVSLPFLFLFSSLFYGSTVYDSSVLRLNKLWRASPLCLT